MVNRKILLIFLLLLLVIPFAFSQLELPENIKKIQEYNKEYAQDFLGKISIPIVFIAGILSLLSPCILPILPAFFAYTFKEKKEISKMTSLFFLGFSLVFVAMGILGVIIGKASLVLLQDKIWFLILIVGILLIALGIMSILGKGFHGIVKQRRFQDDKLGVFVFGVFFALGWSACLGPVITGIILMISVIGNFFTGAYLMFFYSLGIFIPFFILSFFYDKYNLSKSRFIIGKEIRIFDKKINSTNLLSGLLLIIIGIVFVIYRNTRIINGFDPFRIKNYFFEFQRLLLENIFLFNVIGIIAFVIFAYFLLRFLKRRDKK